LDIHEERVSPVVDGLLPGLDDEFFEQLDCNESKPESEKTNIINLNGINSEIQLTKLFSS